MKSLVISTICVSIALPFAAFAQSADVTYCQTLSDTYRKDIGLNSAAAGPVPEAMAGCATKPADSIPVLEKALKDNKVTLPKRG